MSANCLLTKLKAEVNNDSLKRLGVLKLLAKQQTITSASNQQYFTFKSNAEVTITVDGDGYFATSEAKLVSEPLTTITFNGTLALWFANDNYNVYISNKYALTEFINNSGGARVCVLGVDMSEIDFLSSLTKIKYDKSESSGSIAELKDVPGISYIDLSNTNVSGNIAELSKFQTLTVIRFTNTAVEGDINGIGGLTNLNTIYLGTTRVTGSIEGFVANQIAAGRASISDPINFNAATTFLTFGGTKYNRQTETFLKWQSASKIYVFTDGLTYEATTRVYAKGATAEEIAAWEQAGKTVYIIE